MRARTDPHTCRVRDNRGYSAVQHREHGHGPPKGGSQRADQGAILTLGSR